MLNKRKTKRYTVYDYIDDIQILAKLVNTVCPLYPWVLHTQVKKTIDLNIIHHLLLVESVDVEPAGTKFVDTEC